ncbi:MAG: FecR domain-containing protein [Myxococcota bacterium]|nr:FecR family protein [Myxococcota bacterium]
MSFLVTRAALAVALVFVANTAKAQTNGKLTQAQGAVFIKTGEGAEQAGKTGESVPGGTRIRTGADGQAEVTFADGTKMQVRPGTTVALSNAKRNEQKSSVVLFFGRVWSKVSRSVGAETNFEVNTPNAVAGVRGTEFETAVADDGTAKVRVTEGKVAVASDVDSEAEDVSRGEETTADAKGVGDAASSSGEAQWDKFSSDGSARAKKDGGTIAKGMRERLDARRQKLQSLRERQTQLVKQRDSALKRAEMGDSAAAAEVKKAEKELATLGSQIADLADASESQFGYVDHLADLANDPRFGMIDRKTMLAEAKTLRKLKAQFDAMVKEGTDLSMKSMDKMMDDMQKGKPTIKDKKGSSAKDLFDEK